MIQREKILVIGSIADFGGREAEVKTIIRSLHEDYDIKLFSTSRMTKDSMAIDSSICIWTSFYKELYNSNFLLKIIAQVSKRWHKSKLPAYLLVSNKISNRFFDFHKKNLSILKKQIDSVSVVVFCGVLTNGYLQEIAAYCQELNKPLIFRTTGEIRCISEKQKECYAKMAVILVHSESNASVLRSANLNNFQILDQTTLAEKELIEVEINAPTELVYGYIGRFSPEKGAIELLKIFKEIKKKLIIAGDGSLMSEVVSISMTSSNIEYISKIQSDKIVDFFKQIDVLVIPSFEEAGPLVGIEAMAAGKLIISTKVGAMKDRLASTKNNFWFNVAEHQSFLELDILLKNISIEEIIEIRKINRNHYIDFYSNLVIYSQYRQVIGSVLKHNLK